MKRMKSHLTKVSLALLSTVFLLGCQGQGSEPVGPEGPQFDKKGTGRCAAAADEGHCHGGGDDDGGGALQVTFTTDGGFVATDPTLTTLAPTPVNHKLGGGFAMNPITVGGFILQRVDAYPRIKAGNVTEVEFYFYDTEGNIYHAGPPWPSVDPAVPVSDGFTLHLHANGVELRTGNGPNSTVIGTVSIADAVYTPVP